jgi:hypothetical protein
MDPPGGMSGGFPSPPSGTMGWGNRAMRRGSRERPTSWWKNSGRLRVRIFRQTAGEGPDQAPRGYWTTWKQLAAKRTQDKERITLVPRHCLWTPVSSSNFPESQAKTTWRGWTFTIFCFLPSSGVCSHRHWWRLAGDWVIGWGRPCAHTHSHIDSDISLVFQASPLTPPFSLAVHPSTS